MARVKDILYKGFCLMFSLYLYQYFGTSFVFPTNNILSCWEQSIAFSSLHLAAQEQSLMIQLQCYFLVLRTSSLAFTCFFVLFPVSNLLVNVWLDFASRLSDYDLFGSIVFVGTLLQCRMKEQLSGLHTSASFLSACLWVYSVHMLHVEHQSLSSGYFNFIWIAF